MPFVPGFENDVFISYAHGDDRDWINRFLDRLGPALNRLLPGVALWVDKDDLRKSRNFEQDIPESLAASAVLISLVSPTYIERPYCVQQEYRRFAAQAAARKQPSQRFCTPEFSADLFGLRCPILPLPDDSYRNAIFPGATDISFCDDISTYSITSPEFENSFRTLAAGTSQSPASHAQSCDSRVRLPARTNSRNYRRPLCSHSRAPRAELPHSARQ